MQFPHFFTSIDDINEYISNNNINNNTSNNNNNNN